MLRKAQFDYTTVHCVDIDRKRKLNFTDSVHSLF